jgi:hypothetical protein
MRALVAVALLCSAAHADPIELAFVGRHAYIPAGSDHGEWNGLDLALETQPYHRAALRLDIGVDEVAMHSDEASYAYEGTQVTALAGVRLDFSPPHPGDSARLYYAAAIGAGAFHRAMATTDARLYIEPLRLGLDIALTASAALRIEGAVMVHPTSYDPIAVVFDAGVAFRI